VRKRARGNTSNAPCVYSTPGDWQSTLRQFKGAVTMVVIASAFATFRNCKQKMYTQYQSIQKRMDKALLKESSQSTTNG
jgi:hypothetical protein